MGGKASTNLETKVISAVLKLEEGVDILYFEVGGGYKINLNNEKCQNEIKEMFCALLKELLNGPISITFSVSPGYSTMLLIDTCTYYINDLNEELQHVYSRIPAELRQNKAT